jgi:hypothetical protein
LGRVVGALWLVVAAAMFVACACLFFTHLIALALAGMLMVWPGKRIVLGLSCAACAYLVLIGLTTLSRSPTSAQLALALTTTVLGFIVATVSLIAMRRPA